MTTNIFITGVTGYIGGSILHRLQQEGKYRITAFVRDEEKAKKIRELGAEVVIGSLNDSEIITKAASNADAVIHTADAADHLESAKAIIAGLKQRKSTNGKKPIYIHTSGTGVLADFQEIPGASASNKIWTEEELGDPKGINESALHRRVDLVVLKAGEEGIDAAIVCPPLIYGQGSGLFNQRSIQIPMIIKGSLQQKESVRVGNGLNVWNNVHLLDLADLYVLLLGALLEGKAPVNRNGYYFAENGENNFKEISDKVAQILYEKKISTSKESKGLTPEESKNVFRNWWAALAYNSRGKAKKAAHLGWKPKRESLLDSLPQEIDYWNSKKD